MNFALFLSKYRTKWGKPLAPGTKENYGYHLKVMWNWMTVNRVSWERLTSKTFDVFIEDQKGWGNSWQQQALCAAKAYLLWIGDKEHPLHEKTIQRTGPEREERSLTPKELRKLIRGIDLETDKGKRDVVILILACETGMRASELAKLKLNDVDLDDMKIKFTQKGDRLHNPVIPPSAERAIREWLEVRDKYSKPDADTFFVSLGGTKKGSSMTRHGMKDLMRKLSKQTGVDHFSPHVLRKFFCEDGVRRNVNMDLIKKQGGWRTLRMVEHYARAVGTEAYRGHFGNYAQYLE